MSDRSCESIVNMKRNHMGKLVAKREYSHRLHAIDCENSEKDLALMELKLQEDPDCLERKNHPFSRLALLPVATETALFDAAYRDHQNCFLFLVNSGADLNGTDGEYKDIICAALPFSNENVLNCCWKHEFYKKTQKRTLNFYLCEAVNTGCSVHILTSMIKHGIPVDDFNNFDINLKDYSFDSPTVHAVCVGELEFLTFLLLNGAVVDHRQTGRTDLSAEVKDCLSLIHHFVVTSLGLYNGPEVLTLLHQFGANLWERNRHGLTPLEMTQRDDLSQVELQARNNWYDDFYDPEAEGVDTDKTKVQMFELMKKPLRLTSWCRISLVRSMKDKYLENIKRWSPQLPREITSFLQGKDLEPCLI